jgi:hypothetical protein
MSHRVYPWAADANDFNTNRKAKEDDHLMTQQVDERRTRDQFFNKQEEEQAQATFGITPMSSGDDRSINIESDEDMSNPVIGSIQQETDPPTYA